VLNKENNMDYFIANEKDDNGYWFTVYFNGQPINGFRDYFDAGVFAQWYATSDHSTQDGYKAGVDWSSDHD
jgi:hypothetical protein